MKVLIVEDEKKIAQALGKNYKENNFETVVCYDGASALNEISKDNFDIIILDWRIPEVSGIEVCKRLREAHNLTPVILLTALTNISNKVEALDCGADDYLTKPFSFEELLARTNSAIRRSKYISSKIEYKNISLDLFTHFLKIDNEEMKLPEMEFELLKYFLENRNRIISRDLLCSDVWKLKYTPSTNVVDVTVKNLRKKLEEYTGEKFIKSVYGEGYIFIADSEI